ncbi:Kiwa anti-phage protein KwaB-like domain-containing protein [Rhodococcoides kroppenstedtii]|uniref:Kiwa anti-phage protein KwaB-like domain-containing protein n=1 Tax=Rhodococcoides kroppenstedtii TaxID=293050 RepID=UPI00363580D3
MRGAVAALLTKQFIQYDPSYQTSTSQVLVESLADVPELRILDGAVRSGDVPLDAGGTQALAMIHSVGAGEKKVVAYRMKGAGIATRRSRGITLIPRDGLYGPVEGDVLFYEPKFDLITCGDFAYFTAVTLIQTKLRADHKARDLSRSTFRSVTAKLRIEGIEALEAAVVDDPNLRNKMAQIARLIASEPDYPQKLKMGNLIRFIEANSQFGIDLGTVRGKKALLFDPSPQRRHQIPRLLADDYLFSFLTNRSYEAGSKLRLQD